MLAILLAAAIAPGDLLVLPPESPAPARAHGRIFRDLQEAVDAARDGATIRIAEGDHHLIAIPYADPSCGNCMDPATPVEATRGLLVEGKTLHIVGAGTDESVIHTHAGYGILFVRSRGSSLENVTITDGVRDPDGKATDAAVVVRASRVRIRGCKIAGNTGDPAVVEKTVVGLIGIAGREGAEIRAERNEILGNSWDGIALYRGARAVIAENRIDGGRGVGIGMTWDSRAVVLRNWVTHFWKGIGVFVSARATVEDNVIEDHLTWGLSLWEGSGGRPVLRARGNVIYRTGACGVLIARTEGGEPEPGFLLRNVIARTGQNPKYDSGEPYCLQTAIARHAVPPGFAIAGNVLGENREPGDKPGSEDLAPHVFRKKAPSLCPEFPWETRFIREADTRD